MKLLYRVLMSTLLPFAMYHLYQWGQVLLTSEGDATWESLRQMRIHQVWVGITFLIIIGLAKLGDNQC